MTKKIEIHPILATNIAYYKLLQFTNNNSISGNSSCKLYLMEGEIPNTIDNVIDYGTTESVLVTWKNNRIRANHENQNVWLSAYAAVATKSGTVNWLYGSGNGLTFIGTVGLTGSGADLELDDVNIVQGKTYGISNLRIQVPTSFTYPSEQPPTYAVASAANSVDEGSPLTFTVTTTNLPSPTTLYWVVLTNAGDFSTSSGTVTINSNTGSFSVTPTSDTTTEVDAETFTVGILTSALSDVVVATSDPITINDTSQTPGPTYTLTPATDNVDEGSSLAITVGGTNIPNDTYYWTIETGAGEFATVDGTVSVTDNSGTFSVTPTTDVTTEGSETFTVALRSVSITGTILQTSESITINDTSLAPVSEPE